MLRGLQTMDLFLNEMNGAMNKMQKTDSIDLNNSYVEVRVVDSSHDSYINSLAFCSSPVSIA